jgi:hypothetical protein
MFSLYSAPSSGFATENPAGAKEQPLLKASQAIFWDSWSMRNDPCEVESSLRHVVSDPPADFGFVAPVVLTELRLEMMFFPWDHSSVHGE